jgi:tRNA(Ile)-lysidine synthase
MLKQFLEFIQKESLIPSQKGRSAENPGILLTVSGGVDSVTMCHLFHQAGFFFAVAHCNFNLRGEESAGDKKFVSALAKKYNAPFWTKSFHTKPYSKKNKISIQMAARNLRYEWILKVASDNKYNCIATAHHLDDSIETFFINLLRGTGIEGLQGVPVKQGIIIRPLLFATKNTIRNYAVVEKLQWREDSSNQTDRYLRNTIRHHLIPSLKKLNSGFEKTFIKELSYFKDAGEIVKKFIAEKKDGIVVKKGKNTLFNIQKLKESGYAEIILHDLLKIHGFSPETIALVAKRMYTTAGKKFLSPAYRLIKDRGFFILSKNSKNIEKKYFLIKKNQQKFTSSDLNLKISVISGNIEQVKNKTSAIAYIDYARLSFPLKIRKWKTGDFFYPLGMTGKKKLSDFFIDSKIPLSDKEDIYVLESAGNIAWILNHRIDNRFRVIGTTEKILRISIVASINE